MDEQNVFDDFIKTEPEFSNSQVRQNKNCLRKSKTKCDVLGDDTTLTTFNDFEYQPTEQFETVGIKEEIIECEMPKIEGSSDLPTKIDQGTVHENVQIFPKTIKQEPENTGDVEVADIIKQEVSECIQPKTESGVCELLTSECDLPTLKLESTVDYPDYYLGHTSHVVSKKKRRRSYMCPICQKNFPSSKSRSTHIDVHFKKRYAVCQYCGRLMKKIDFIQHFFIHVIKNRLKSHIDDKPLIHYPSSKKLQSRNIDEVDNNSFKCGTCLKTFNIKSKLQRHLIIHSTEKPFNCAICLKGFIQKSHLQEHLLIHSAEKPFKCEICNKGLNRKSHLQKHLLLHNGEKPFKCDICSQGFNQKSNLQDHLIIHSGKKPFKCDICSNRFTRKTTLHRHLLIHSGEKPFKCDICFKGFTQKTHLQEHLQLHNGKTFQCDICSKGFNRKPYLQKHLLIHC